MRTGYRRGLLAAGAMLAACSGDVPSGTDGGGSGSNGSDGGGSAMTDANIPGGMGEPANLTGITLYHNQVRAAVNQEFAPPEAPVRPGDEVAFFPPVTGG